MHRLVSSGTFGKSHESGATQTIDAAQKADGSSVDSESVCPYPRTLHEPAVEDPAA